MEFLYRDLGQQPRGAIASVSLSGQAANVWLMDTSTFSAFKAGRGGRAQGGRATRSPVNFEIPRSGRWYVVVENGGRPWRGRWGVQVLPPQPAPIRTTRSGALGSIADAIDDAHGEGFEAAYDVFISHATEDKASLVRPLADALRARNLDVWYDDFELKLGSSLRQSIDRGIASSRFGIVVLSEAFFAKNWTNYELNGLVAREMHGGRQLVLPLWHNISKSEVLAASPSLADKVALRTSDYTVEEIADQVADAIRR
ncbi:DUF1883 domain-containing protein [Miltoncostaea marina]|uniref:DUF1883 domain-containing protein n=1 Tax=Miltoncostaea marina TaxID=2843215 RepID=UPI001C3C878A|nr:DUF1883 domain-containing protein [Miltoncostaea marina]